MVPRASGVYKEAGSEDDFNTSGSACSVASLYDSGKGTRFSCEGAWRDDLVDLSSSVSVVDMESARLRNFWSNSGDTPGDENSRCRPHSVRVR